MTKVRDGSQGKLYDHTFTPVLRDGDRESCERCKGKGRFKVENNPNWETVYRCNCDRMVVADERVWNRLYGYTAPSNPQNQPVTPAIRIPPVLFEDWGGQVVNAKGEALRLCSDCGDWCADKGEDNWQTICKPGCSKTRNQMPPITMPDVRQRVFSLIDNCPNCLFVLEVEAKDAGRFEQILPNYEWHACETGDCPHTSQDQCDRDPSRKYRCNVILSLVARTQAELESGAAELLNFRDLCEGIALHFQPTELITDCSPSFGFLEFCHIEISGTHTSQLEWIETIVAQAGDAGVPVWNGFEGGLIIP